MARWAVGSAVVVALSSFQMLVAVHSASAQSAPDRPAAPSFARTVVGTVTGGVLGASLAGGTSYLLGSAADGGNDGLSAGAAVFALTAPVGFWLGQAVGAARGASTPDHPVAARRTMLPAALWTAAGFAGYLLIGDGFDSEGNVDYTSWYVGAAIGLATSTLGTSWSAYGTAMRGWNLRSEPRLSLGLRPSRQGTPILVARVRTSW